MLSGLAAGRPGRHINKRFYLYEIPDITGASNTDEEDLLVKVISREELKEKLDRGDDFKLVMTLSDWAFQAKHIPGSLHIDKPEKASSLLDPQDEIVVYCSNVVCTASQMAYHYLTSKGYQNVRRYAGGIEDWELAGYPLEGEMAGE